MLHLLIGLAALVYIWRAIVSSNEKRERRVQLEAAVDRALKRSHAERSDDANAAWVRALAALHNLKD